MNKKRQQVFTTAETFNLFQMLHTAWSQLEQVVPGGLQPREKSTLGQRDREEGGAAQNTWKGLTTAPY